MSFLAGLLILCVHANSQSSSRVTVEGAQVHVALRCEALSWFEVLPELDANGDGLLVSSELEAARAGLAAYLRDHYVLRVEGALLVSGPPELQLAAPDPRRLFPEPQQVDVALEYRAEHPLRALELEVTLFHDTSPDHREFTQVLWNGAAPTSLVLERARPRARLPLSAEVRGGAEPVAQARGAGFLRLGVEHILSGWDHLAFLVALFLAARGLRSLVGVVTAFSVAHSITLALAALELVHVPARLVETAIALSIAYVGADNLLFPEARAKWPEAFAFGLVHGLGFAGFLEESLLTEASKTWALLAFNLGVEAGQLCVVFALLLAWRLLRLGPRAVESGLVTARTRRVGSLLVTVLGLYWFVERAWL